MQIERNQVASATESVSPPVAPLPELLPLGDPNLPWERFEAFCRDFISRLPGVRTCYHYGKLGNRQRGIDLVAELDDGSVWVFQCKQRRHQTKVQVEKAVEATTYRADHYILVTSCVVGTEVRDSISQHANWDVWDARDISQKVRELPVDQAARLVHHSFGPAWRTAFVGLTERGPFVSTQEFFEPFMDSRRLFNHAWAFVGREQHLLQLEEFARSKEHQVAIVTGRGGIGKTKLLNAVAERLSSESSYEVRFVADGIPLTPESPDALPGSGCLLIVDDAHRREEIEELLSIARQRSQSMKLLLSARPYGLDHLQSSLTQFGFDPRQIVIIDEVKELGRDEVAQLARQALGGELEGLADKLTAVTWDCPLVTVVGGRLLAEKQLPLELLERDDEFRQTVLARFRDVLIGQVSDLIEPALCRSLLEVIAAIGPLRISDERLKEGAAEFLGIEPHALLQALGALEQGGVLIRRGYSLRVTPDVLADHILHGACLTPSGVPTGYAEVIFEKFASVCPAEVLRNLSELDWRINVSADQEISLLSNIWNSIEAEFRDATHAGRSRILDVLEQTAYYQPSRVVDLAELAMRQPAEGTAKEQRPAIYEYTHQDVLQRLPEILRRIGYTLNYLPRCCDLLWDLGREDARPVNRYPEHPIRVLQDLASYQPGKPLIMNEIVLDAVDRWLSEPGGHGHAHSPLDILDPLLAKSGDSSHSEGYRVVFRPFLVSEKNTRALRDRALGIFATCAQSPEQKTALRAIESLENALREPVGYFGMEISDEIRDTWVPEQLQVLDKMGQLASGTSDPLVHLSIWKALRWHARRGSADDVMQTAQAIVNSIPKTDELRMTQLLMYTWDPFSEPDDGEDFHEAIRKHEQDLKEMRQLLASRFMATHPSAGDGAQALEDQLRAIEASGHRPEPQLFLFALAEADRTYASAFCEEIIAKPDGALAPYLGIFLRGSRLGNVEHSLQLARRAVETGDASLSAAVAQSYWWDGWTDNLLEQDIEILRSLLESEDPFVKRAAIRSLATLGRAQPRLALGIALSVDVGSDQSIANELFQVLQRGWGVPIEEVDDDEINILLEKLISVEDIDEHSIREFITAAARRDAVSTIRFLIKRLEFAGQEDRDYRPLPFQPLDLGDIETSSDYENVLREIRDQALAVTPIVREFYLPNLFRAASKNFTHAAAVGVLIEWIESGDGEKIEAASSILKGAPSDFVFEEVGLVEKLIEKSHEVGDECYRDVCGDLYGSAISGTFSGTPGLPMPRDVAIRDRALKVGSRFALGSPVRNFYDSLVRHAEASIQDTLVRAEEEFE